MSASDALAAVKTLYDITNKVKDNKNELLRLTQRIEHIVVTLNDCRSRDIIRSDEYNDALSAISNFIIRAERLAQRLLKRNLGDRTWNAGEISSDLRRLNDDVQNYLSVHTVRALDLIHSSNVEHQSVLTNNMEEIMVKIAELDLFLRTRTQAEDGWAPSIRSQAQTNIQKRINESENSLGTQRNSPNSPPSDSLIRSQAQTNIPKRITNESENSLGTQHNSPNSPPGGSLIRSQAQTNIQKRITNESEISLDTQLKGQSESSSPRFPPSSFKLPFPAYFRSSRPKSVDTKHNYPHFKKRSSSPRLPPLPVSADSGSPEPECISGNEHPIGVDIEGLIQSGNFTLMVTGLRKDSDDHPQAPLSTLNLRLRGDATLDEVKVAIKDAGFIPPDNLEEEPELRISVTEGDSVYDASTPGGLKVNKFEPLLWWWNKYTAYHGLILATTPSQTIARLQRNPAGVAVGEAQFIFHRTLRVPESGINNLPASLGTFPLIPVDSNSRGIPPAVRERGGFLMPMFRREAVWIQFNKLEKEWSSGSPGPAVKISVGGVNAVSGISTHSIEPPKFGAEQDYVVVGQQPWLDGIVSGPGVVRQFVATDLGSGYTVEEQVTGKAEIGGFQFDIFPRRPDASFLWAGRKVDSVSSPSELGMVGDQFVVKECFGFGLWQGWSVSDYKRRVSSTAPVKALYYIIPRLMRWGSTFPTSAGITSPGRILGLAAGGKIVQKIYRDTDSPRVYDQENGRRFYVHIVTPELWETITGVLPPITPITREMYTLNGVNWYKLLDDYVDSITVVSEPLSNVLSVTQLDEQNSASSAQSQLPDLIDPNAPPGCSIHPRERSSCVFRPCSHVACSKCLGSAMLAGSKCPKCHAGIEKFVGMLTPIPVISLNTGNTDQEGEWSVEETERLATIAAGSDTVVVIHPLEDRPSPLYSSGHCEDIQVG